MKTKTKNYRRNCIRYTAKKIISYGLCWDV